MKFGPDELANACNNYRKANRIGHGGFGTIYKGTVRGCLDVAVKILTQVASYTCNNDRKKFFLCMYVCMYIGGKKCFDAFQPS